MVYTKTIIIVIIISVGIVAFSHRSFLRYKFCVSDPRLFDPCCLCLATVALVSFDYLRHIATVGLSWLVYGMRPVIVLKPLFSREKRTLTICEQDFATLALQRRQ